jgi:hypothetical protein
VTLVSLPSVHLLFFLCAREGKPVPISIVRGLAALKDLVHRFDMQHAVIEMGARDLHVIGKAEAPLDLRAMARSG